MHNTTPTEPEHIEPNEGVEREPNTAPTEPETHTEPDDDEPEGDERGA